jgi:hypothetical protein
MIPGFSVPRLRAMHEHTTARVAFVWHSRRVQVEARRPQE